MWDILKKYIFLIFIDNILSSSSKISDCYTEVGNDAKDRSSWLQNQTSTLYLDLDNPLPEGFITKFTVHVHRPTGKPPVNQEVYIIVYHPLGKTSDRSAVTVKTVKVLKWKLGRRMKSRPQQMELEIDKRIRVQDGDRLGWMTPQDHPFYPSMDRRPSGDRYLTIRNQGRDLENSTFIFWKTKPGVVIRADISFQATVLKMNCTRVTSKPATTNIIRHTKGPYLPPSIMTSRRVATGGSTSQKVVRKTTTRGSITTSVAPAGNNQDSGALGSHVYIIIAVGAVVLLLIITVVIIVIARRKKRKEDKPNIVTQENVYQDLNHIENGSTRSYEHLIKQEGLNMYDNIEDQTKPSVRYSKEPTREERDEDEEHPYLEIVPDKCEFVKDVDRVKDVPESDYVPVYLELCPECCVKETDVRNIRKLTGYMLNKDNRRDGGKSRDSPNDASTGKNNFRRSVQQIYLTNNLARKDLESQLDDDYDLAFCPKCKSVGSNGSYMKNDVCKHIKDRSSRTISDFIGGYLLQEAETGTERTVDGGANNIGKKAEY